VDLMASGLSFRAITEFIKSDNLQGLKVFLENRHINVEDKDEVRTYFNLDLLLIQRRKTLFLVAKTYEQSLGSYLDCRQFVFLTSSMNFGP
jgi:hypothetical protein